MQKVPEPTGSTAEAGNIFLLSKKEPEYIAQPT